MGVSKRSGGDRQAQEVHVAYSIVLHDRTARGEKERGSAVTHATCASLPALFATAGPRTLSPSRG